MNIINYNNFKYSSITIDEPIVNNNIMNINMKYNNNNIYIKTPLLKIHSINDDIIEFKLSECNKEKSFFTFIYDLEDLVFNIVKKNFNNWFDNTENINTLLNNQSKSWYINDKSRIIIKFNFNKDLEDNYNLKKNKKIGMVIKVSDIEFNENIYSINFKILEFHNKNNNIKKNIYNIHNDLDMLYYSDNDIENFNSEEEYDSDLEYDSIKKKKNNKKIKKKINRFKIKQKDIKDCNKFERLNIKLNNLKVKKKIRVLYRNKIKIINLN